MKDNEGSQKQRLGRARIAVALMSLVAIGSVAMAIYAFNQKKEARVQAKLAEQRALEAQEQQNFAFDQKLKADSTIEQEKHQREIAMENEKRALQQKQIADSETLRAVQSSNEAIKQTVAAQRSAAIAKQAEDSAEENLKKFKAAKAVADTQTTIAEKATMQSNTLQNLAESRKLAIEALLLLNENHIDSGKYKALEAYRLNKAYKGVAQNNDIYNALNSVWIKSINNKNQCDFHNIPVHCVSSMANDMIITADEKGKLSGYVLKNNSLQKVAEYYANEEIRALCVSPRGNKLIAVSSMGSCFILNVSASNISVQTTFKFPGVGKSIAFTSAEEFIILSNKGMGRYHLSSNIAEGHFFNIDGIGSFVFKKNGEFYISVGNIIKKYSEWKAVILDSVADVIRFDSKISSLAIDKHEQYLAAGTYNGNVLLYSLKTNSIAWKGALHLSNVTDLEFTGDDSMLQLATASTDQNIKLIDINALFQKNYTENIITLKGHTKWIYALCYTPNGKWLISAGEDGKVIAWKTSTNDLYQTLLQ